PAISTNIAFPAAVSIDVTSLVKSSSESGLSPSWPRQRLTFITNPPPSPANILTLTAACSLSAPVIRNLAANIGPPEISFQSAGTCQLGFPSLVGGVPAVGMGIEPKSPIGRCEGGRSVRFEPVTKLTVLRKSTKAGFCCATTSSSPFILKNHA